METPIKTNNRKLKLSRKELMQRNPVIWIAILTFTTLWFALSLFPDIQNWQSQKAENQDLISKNEVLQKEADQLQIEANKLSINLQESAKDFSVEESQRFPDLIETDKIAKILETYTWLLNQKHGGRGGAEIQTLSFSGTKVVENQPYYQTNGNLSINITKQGLQDFIYFLKNGKYDPTLRDALKNFGDEYFFSDLKVNFDFLDNNLLPINHITSLTINESKSEDPRKEVYKIQMQVDFFSLEDPTGYSAQKDIKTKLNQ